MCMKVIVISGKAQHGKDTTGSFIKEELEAAGKRVIITHYGDLLKYICEKFFDWDGRKDEKGRTLLQYIGTNIVRNQNPRFWTDFLVGVAKLFDGTWDYMIIPDTRFPNEVTCWYANGYKTTHIEVVRDGFDSGLTAEQMQHPSENALKDFKPDIEIHNDGSLEDLKERAKKIVKENILNG